MAGRARPRPPAPAAAPCWRRNSRWRAWAALGLARSQLVTSANRPASRPCPTRWPGQLPSSWLSSRTKGWPTGLVSTHAGHITGCGGLCRLLPLAVGRDHDPRAFPSCRSCIRPAGRTRPRARHFLPRPAGHRRQRHVRWPSLCRDWAAHAGALQGRRSPPRPDTWCEPVLEPGPWSETPAACWTQTSSSARRRSARVPPGPARRHGEHPPRPPQHPAKSRQAARAVDPVAMPSSTTTAIRPSSGAPHRTGRYSPRRGRPPRRPSPAPGRGPRATVFPIPPPPGQTISG